MQNNSTLTTSVNVNRQLAYNEQASLDEHDVYICAQLLQNTGKRKGRRSAVQYLYRIHRETLRRGGVMSTHAQEARYHNVSVSTIQNWEEIFYSFGLISFKRHQYGLFKQTTSKGIQVIEFFMGDKPFTIQQTNEPVDNSFPDFYSKCSTTDLNTDLNSPIPYTDTDKIINIKTSEILRRVQGVDNDEKLVSNGSGFKELCKAIHVQSKDRLGLQTWMRRNQITHELLSHALDAYVAYSEENVIEKPAGLLIEMLKTELHIRRVTRERCPDEDLIDISVEKAANILRKMDIDPTISDFEVVQAGVLEALQIQRHN